MFFIVSVVRRLQPSLFGIATVLRLRNVHWADFSSDLNTRGVYSVVVHNCVCVFSSSIKQLNRDVVWYGTPSFHDPRFLAIVFAITYPEKEKIKLSWGKQSGTYFSPCCCYSLNKMRPVRASPLLEETFFAPQRSEGVHQRVRFVAHTTPPHRIRSSRTNEHCKAYEPPPPETF